MSRRETNLHFTRPPRPRHEDHQQPTTSPVPPLVQDQERHGQPPLGGAHTPHEDHHRLRVPFVPPVQDQEHLGQLPPSLRGARTRREDQPRRQGRPRVKIIEPSPEPHESPVLPPHDYPPEQRQPYHEHHGQPQPHHEHRQPRHEQRGHHHGLRVPTPQKTKPYTWFAAVFCVIFWLVIIIGGLIVLIVYLVFRPQSPHFDVSGVALNAAYLDLGYLLNADLTMLANFTNPNRKVHVDFSSIIIYLYYGSTLIAAQYVEPFSAAKAESRFASIHMVISQVQLPFTERQRLVKQMESNGVLFDVRGVFRARSKLGSILRYSYNLYGLCSVMVTRPPDGILVKKKCRTKR